MSQVYGSIDTCTQDADADTGTANAVAMAAGGRYAVYCHDGAGSYVACECAQGTSTVNAGSVVGVLITSPKVFVQRTGNTHISCVPFVDNMMVDVCALD